MAKGKKKETDEEGSMTQEEALALDYASKQLDKQRVGMHSKSETLRERGAQGEDAFEREMTAIRSGERRGRKK